MASISELSPVASSEHDSDDLQLEASPDEEDGFLQETVEKSASSTTQTWNPVVGVPLSRDLSSEFTRTSADKERTARGDGKRAPPRIDKAVRWLHFFFTLFQGA